MPMPVQGQRDAVPTDPDRPPARSAGAGEQDLKWVIDGPQSQLDWAAKERADTVLTLRRLGVAVGVIVAVYLVGFVYPLVPAEWMLVAAGFAALFLLFRFMIDFVVASRVERHTLPAICLGLVLAGLTRLFHDPRLTWFVALPAALGACHLTARGFADGFARWCACLLTAPRAERAAAVGEWGRATGPWGTAAAAAPVTAGYLAALAAKAAGRHDGLAVATLVGGAFVAWCAGPGRGRDPLHVAYVAWRVVKLAVCYNAPLPSGRVREEPFTYQMPGLLRRAADRQRALDLTAALVAVAVAPLLAGPAPPPGWEVSPFTLRWLADAAAGVALGVALPLVLLFTVLAAGFAAPAADVGDRFAAAAVAAAERRSS